MQHGTQSCHCVSRAIVDSRGNVGKCSISLDILFDKDVWIADTGASNHGTYSNLGGKNAQASATSNLGIHGGAVKVDKTIDISGQFVKKNGQEGLRATLTAVNVTPGSNFNVCSVARLLVQG